MGSFSEGESMASVSAPTKGSSSVEVQGPRVLNLFTPSLVGGRQGWCCGGGDNEWQAGGGGWT